MKKIYTTLLTAFYLTLSASPAFAIITNPIISNPTVASSDPKTYFNSVLAAVISIFFIVGIIYFIWHIVFAGYHLIASEGDPKKWESSKEEIIYACIGLFAIFSIFAILKLIGKVVGIPGLETLTITWPTL